jgi:hypothetical protein
MLLVPVPVVAVPPGLLVNVHVPVGGRPFNATLPVAAAHVGWVIVPTAGVEGAVHFVVNCWSVPLNVPPQLSAFTW